MPTASSRNPAGARDLDPGVVAGGDVAQPGPGVALGADDGRDRRRAGQRGAAGRVAAPDDDTGEAGAGLGVDDDVGPAVGAGRDDRVEHVRAQAVLVDVQRAAGDEVGDERRAPSGRRGQVAVAGDVDVDQWPVEPLAATIDGMAVTVNTRRPSALRYTSGAAVPRLRVTITGMPVSWVGRLEAVEADPQRRRAVDRRHLLHAVLLHAPLLHALQLHQVLDEVALEELVRGLVAGCRERLAPGAVAVDEGGGLGADRRDDRRHAGVREHPVAVGVEVDELPGRRAGDADDHRDAGLGAVDRLVAVEADPQQRAVGGALLHAALVDAALLHVGGVEHDGAHLEVPRDQRRAAEVGLGLGAEHDRRQHRVVVEEHGAAAVDERLRRVGADEHVGQVVEQVTPRSRRPWPGGPARRCGRRRRRSACRARR